jgi:hypothetical protein
LIQRRALFARNTDGARTEISKVRTCLNARTFAGAMPGALSAATASESGMPNQAWRPSPNPWISP